MTKKVSSQYNIVSAVLAFCIWGGWSFYINDVSLFSRVVSGLTQGISSFLITFVMVKLVSWFFHKHYFAQFKLIFPAVATVACTGSVLIAIHFAVGTPNITETVIPPLSFALLFCLYTSYKLKCD